MRGFSQNLSFFFRKHDGCHVRRKKTSQRNLMRTGRQGTPERIENPTRRGPAPPPLGDQKKTGNPGAGPRTLRDPRSPGPRPRQKRPPSAGVSGIAGPPGRNGGNRYRLRPRRKSGREPGGARGSPGGDRAGSCALQQRDPGSPDRRAAARVFVTAHGNAGRSPAIAAGPAALRAVAAPDAAPHQ
jgi:hypothetical protein